MPSNPTITKEQVIDRFCSRGWERHHGFGVAANVYKESSFRHRVVGDKGKAFGLCQWHGDRQANFRKAFGCDIRESTWQQQVDFIDWELRNTEKAAGAKLRACTTAFEAGAVISRFYERPKLRDIEAQRRGELAQQWFDDNQREMSERAIARGEGPAHGV